MLFFFVPANSPLYKYASVVLQLTETTGEGSPAYREFW